MSELNIKFKRTPFQCQASVVGRLVHLMPGVRMNGDAVNEDVLHRCLLLAKALEAAPLDRALEVARAADEFLRGGAQVVAARALPTVPVMEATTADPCPTLDEPEPPLVHEAEPARAEAETLVAEEVRAAKPETDPRRSALIEDVVRYLRRRDDTVVPKGEDLFLVNARFPMSSDELISRANRMRERDGKSTFQLAPAGGSSPTVVTTHP
jgi:hypothetical protein